MISNFRVNWIGLDKVTIESCYRYSPVSNNYIQSNKDMNIPMGN